MRCDFPSKSYFIIIKDLFFLIAIILISCVFLYKYSDFQFINGEEYRALPLLIATTPILAFYALLRLLLNSIKIPALCTIGMSLAISIAHQKKQALTGAPLSWSDITNLQNIRIAITYLEWWQISIILVAPLFFGYSIWNSYNNRLRNEKPAIIFNACVLAITAIIAFHPYLPNGDLHLKKRATRALQKIGIVYIAFEWNVNVRQNGIFLHLVQTSRRTIPVKATKKNLEESQRLPTPPTTIQSPKHVFFILCEACWHDENNFEDIFQPLKEEGFLAMRGTSPAYGGGTVNATFEMLTALPANSALNGVIFQEYAEIIDDDAKTIISAMRKKGFETYSIHNFYRNFWKRPSVLKKLGFDHFIGIEDMHYNGTMFFPRDKVLFDETLEILQKNSHQHMLFNLETVYTHGTYKINNDWGEYDYMTRLRTTIEDIKNFVEKAREIDNDALFVIYGDHKPALTKYFYERGVLKESLFVKTGDKDEDFMFVYDIDQELLGDVPVYIGGGDLPRLRRLKELANGKPLYCLSAMIDRLYLSSGSLASRYAQESICNIYVRGQYSHFANMMPDWVYSASLF